MRNAPRQDSGRRADGSVEVIALGLGSNLGDRLAHLRRGVQDLAEDMDIVACSSVYESGPVGYRRQGPFLNLVVVATAAMEPAEALVVARVAESRSGRLRTRRWGPRTLDVDLLFWGDRVIDDPGLRIPHPRWRKRSFVLAPLAEVAPELLDPESGVTVSQIWDELSSELEPVEVWGPPLLIPSPGTIV